MKNIASLFCRADLSRITHSYKTALYLMNSLHTTDQAGLELLILSANPKRESVVVVACK
jgi:hypothetical protein